MKQIPNGAKCSSTWLMNIHIYPEEKPAENKIHEIITYGPAGCCKYKPAKQYTMERKMVGLRPPASHATRTGN